MRVYSDLLKRPFDTAEELNAAEAKYHAAIAKEKAEKEAAVAQRKTDAKEIEGLLKSKRDLEKEINEKLTAFCQKYGAFHYSLKEPETTNPFDYLFDQIFHPFF